MATTSHPPLVLAVDGGQSSSLALVATTDGQILGAGPGGPANHYHEPGGPERLRRAMTDSTLAALEAAGQTPEQITHAVLGMTGAMEQAQALVQELLPHASVHSYHDSVTALAGASVARPGVVVIAGTGAVAYGRLTDGREALAGGWGYIMGDEGSGHDIGINALRAITQAADGRGAPTLLSELVPQHFGLTSLKELHAAIYRSAIDRTQIASLCRVVAAAASRGDAVATTLLANAAADLAHLALTVIERLGQIDAGLDVYTTGGVFQSGRFISEPFARAIERRSPASRVHEAAFAPVVGALFLALQAAGTTLTDEVLANIRATLPRRAISKQSEQD